MAKYQIAIIVELLEYNTHLALQMVPTQHMECDALRGANSVLRAAKLAFAPRNGLSCRESRCKTLLACTLAPQNAIICAFGAKLVPKYVEK